MADARPLQGIRVLVTRPAPQADPLCRMIEADGGTALRLPLLSVEPTSRPADAQQRLAAGHDLWIFTSVNAVRHALPLVHGPWPSQLAAIGPATAAALAAAGQGATLTPLGGASSEALLELPELRQMSGRRVLIVTGEGGRGVIEPALAARGAQVERAEVYRRVALPYPPEAVEDAVRKARVIIVTSGEALEHLLRIAPPAAQPALLRRTLVVPSARVVEKARELGFTQPPRVVDPVSDAALCAACAAPSPEPGYER